MYTGSKLAAAGAALALLTLRAAATDGGYDTFDAITAAGYAYERYDVLTEDGYVLGVTRIPRGRGDGSGAPAARPVVFMMHGLFGFHGNFIGLGPETAMAFNLADAGFDVWLGDARGVCLSRRHVALDPDGASDKFAFFNYSFEEIALYDLPAMVELALRTSGQGSLAYVGHSQGGTVFLVLNAMKPDYSAKFATAHLLAGIGYQNIFPNAPLKRIAFLTDPIYALGTAAGVVELTGNASGTISLKQYAHYGQNVRDERFRRWRPSPLGNLAAYGTLQPLAYDLRHVNVDITMHYSLGDEYQNERDVLAMVADLPNARARRVARPDFTHVDYIVSRRETAGHRLHNSGSAATRERDLGLTAIHAQ